jgi:long-subunit fatty acid transport protein
MQNGFRIGFFVFIFVFVFLFAPQFATAGGYDTPMLYSARHIGMGGTAIGYVNDPSAIFHNPAGLARIGSISLLADFSLLLGRINGSPDVEFGEPINTESELTKATFFLLGGAFRITDWFVAGIGIYPVASAGGAYKYEKGNEEIEDETKLFFLEISPAIAFELPGRVTLGAGYRVTIVRLTRTKENLDSGDVVHDFKLKGTNFLGFRVGAQWEAIKDHFSIGVSYRHVTNTETTTDKGTALMLKGEDISTTFTLPSRLGFGARGDIVGLGIALDFEYGFNSQNTSHYLKGTQLDEDGNPRLSPDGEELKLDVKNVFNWSDNITVRVGAEYDFHLSGTKQNGYTITPRLGYIFDSKTSNSKYATAFGTPPAPSHSLTAGLGFDGGPWEVNVAYAFRFGGTTVEETDTVGCKFCGYEGNYEIRMNAIYLDLSWDFE